MARVDITWEGGTLTQNVDAPDVEALTGSIVYDNTAGRVLHGSKAAKFSPAAGVTNYARVKSGLNTQRLGWTIPVYYGDPAAADTHLTQLFSAAGSRMLTILRNGLSQWRVLDQTGTTSAFARWTSQQTAVEDRYQQVKLWAELGTPSSSGATDAATRGKVKIGLYEADGSTLIEPIQSLTGLTLGTSPIDQLRVGKSDAGSFASPFWVDTVSYDVEATDLLPTYSTTAELKITITVSPNPLQSPGEATDTIAPQGGTGAPKTYAVDWGDGQVTAAQSGTTVKHSYAKVDVDTDYLIRVTAKEV